MTLTLINGNGNRRVKRTIIVRSPMSRRGQNLLLNCNKTLFQTSIYIFGGGGIVQERSGGPDPQSERRRTERGRERSSGCTVASQWYWLGYSIADQSRGLTWMTNVESSNIHPTDGGETANDDDEIYSGSPASQQLNFNQHEVVNVGRRKKKKIHIYNNIYCRHRHIHYMRCDAI